jgi:phage terminase Nu1 subunit (DNA packaging protein)
MPTKSDRRVPLPAGLLPLLSQRELETYYGVSDWTVLQWIEKGLPVEPFGARGRRFDLNKVRDWMAEHGQQLAATA